MNSSHISVPAGHQSARTLARLIDKMIDWVRLNRLGQDWVKQMPQHRAFQKALAQAYTVWMPSHQDWTDYLFDKYFLTHRAAPLLTRYLEGAPLPEANELAQLWAKQFTWFDEAMRQRHIAALVPAVAHFLNCLEAALGDRPERLSRR
jgi:hypothetical protein